MQAGLAAARRRGRHGGRPVVIDSEKLGAVITALDGGASKAAVCRTFGLKRSTLLDTLARAGWSAGGRPGVSRPKITPRGLGRLPARRAVLGSPPTVSAGAP